MAVRLPLSGQRPTAPRGKKATAAHIDPDCEPSQLAARLGNDLGQLPSVLLADMGRFQ